MQISFQNIAEGKDEAYRNLIETIAEFGAINDVEARIVADCYLSKRGYVKLDHVMRRPMIKNGIMYDRDFIRAVLDQETQGLAST